MGPTDEEW